MLLIELFHKGGNSRNSLITNDTPTWHYGYCNKL